MGVPALIGGAAYGALKGTKKLASKGSPPPQDYSAAARGMAQQSAANTAGQTQANRPDQQGPYGGTNWTQNPDGSWRQNTGFTGQTAEANQLAQQQLIESMKQPLQDGQAARDQAINAAYGQATSRLDPMWNKREEMARTRLLNQGLDPTSEAARGLTSDMGLQRNDAYGSAMNAAIGQGTEAGNSVFRNSLLAKSYPLQQLQGMQSLLTQPQFLGAGKAETPNLLGAAQAQGGDALQRWQIEQQMWADIMRGATGLAEVPFKNAQAGMKMTGGG